MALPDNSHFVNAQMLIMEFTSDRRNRQTLILLTNVFQKKVETEFVIAIENIVPSVF